MADYSCECFVVCAHGLRVLFQKFLKALDTLSPRSCATNAVDWLIRYKTPGNETPSLDRNYLCKKLFGS